MAQPETAPHAISYTVDDEPFETAERTLTPRKILELAGIDPATHYLVQVEGRHQTSYQAEPEATLHMRPGMTFISVSTAPTPVS